MRRNFSEIVGLDKTKKVLKDNGIEITAVDEAIAQALMEIAQESAIRGYVDNDGIISHPIRGFIVNLKVLELLEGFPNVEKLILQLNRNDNYGFVNYDGTVERTGMMGNSDPIMELQKMIKSYVVTDKTCIPIYASKKDYEAEYMRKFDEEFDQRLRQTYGDDLGKPRSMVQSRLIDGSVEVEGSVKKAQRPRILK